MARFALPSAKGKSQRIMTDAPIQGLLLHGAPKRLVLTKAPTVTQPRRRQAVIGFLR
jgi:hypothetical protein